MQERIFQAKGTRDILFLKEKGIEDFLGGAILKHQRRIFS